MHALLVVKCEDLFEARKPALASVAPAMAPVVPAHSPGPGEALELTYREACLPLSSLPPTPSVAPTLCFLAQGHGVGHTVPAPPTA